MSKQPKKEEPEEFEYGPAEQPGCKYDRCPTRDKCVDGCKSPK